MSRGGQVYYIQADHQGSVIRVTDSAGAVVNSYTYDAYGQRLTATEGVEIAYGYTGREYDAESGLMYYRARVYDTATGRFLQTDPLGFAAGDLNLYRYVANDPVNQKDPNGKFARRIIGCAIGGLAAASGELAGSILTEKILDELAKNGHVPPKPCGRLDEQVNEALFAALPGCIGGLVSPAVTVANINAVIAAAFVDGVRNSLAARGISLGGMN
jgi:RHS repeat-associated protein